MRQWQTHFAMEDPEVGLESRTTLDEGEDGIPFAENTELRGEILLLSLIHICSDPFEN